MTCPFCTSEVTYRVFSKTTRGLVTFPTEYTFCPNCGTDYLRPMQEDRSYFSHVLALENMIDGLKNCQNCGNFDEIHYIMTEYECKDYSKCYENCLWRHKNG